MPSPQLKVSPKMKFKMSRMFGRLQFFEGFTHYNAFSDISRYYHPAAMAILLCELCENTQEFYEFHRPYTRDALGRMTSEGGWTFDPETGRCISDRSDRTGRNEPYYHMCFNCL